MVAILSGHFQRAKPEQGCFQILKSNCFMTFVSCNFHIGTHFWATFQISGLHSQLELVLSRGPKSVSLSLALSCCVFWSHIYARGGKQSRWRVWSCSTPQFLFVLVQGKFREETFEVVPLEANLSGLSSHQLGRHKFPSRKVE